MISSNGREDQLNKKGQKYLELLFDSKAVKVLACNGFANSWCTERAGSIDFSASGSQSVHTALSITTPVSYRSPTGLWYISVRDLIRLYFMHYITSTHKCT